MTSVKSPKPTAAEYEKLGRSLEGVLIGDYLNLVGNPRRQMWLSFLRGIAAGLGGVVGATVIVGLIVWLLHMFGGVPLVGHFLQTTGSQITGTK